MTAAETLANLRNELLDAVRRFAPPIPNTAARFGPVDQGTIERVTVVAKTVIDRELGALNDFSTSISNIKIFEKNGFGPTLTGVMKLAAVLQGASELIASNPSTPASLPNKPELPSYVHSLRIAEVVAASSIKWDMRRLVRLCEELNSASDQGCHMSVAMLVRSITDHVPPIFGMKSFSEVANNHGGKSFRDHMGHLNESLRKVADKYLHAQIRPSEGLPTSVQVDFRSALDSLLEEVVRIAR
jgi:hypothetical protein